MCSVDLPDYPKQKPYKRSRNQVMGWVIKPDGCVERNSSLLQRSSHGGSKVVALLHTDMRFKKVAKAIADKFAPDKCEEWVKTLQSTPTFPADKLPTGGLTGWLP